jgi:hypothetical protein
MDNNQNKRTELLVLITPYVLKSPDEARAETQRLHKHSEMQDVLIRGWSDSPLARPDPVLEKLAQKRTLLGKRPRSQHPPMPRHPSCCQPISRQRPPTDTAMKVAAILCVAATVLGSARATEWERYQVILDRQPFGTLAAKDATVTPDYAKSLRLSALWQVHGQPRAGFEDVSTKTNQSFVLACGEKSEDGLELVEVRYADEAVVVRKGTEVTVLHMQAGVSTNAPLNIAAPPGSPGAPTVNPWREFYERYRQRRRDERGNNPASPAMPGGEAMPPMPMRQAPDGNMITAPPMPTAISPDTERQLTRDGIIPRRRR